MSAGGAEPGAGWGEAERPSEIGAVLWRREGRTASERRARPRTLVAPRPHLAPGRSGGRREGSALRGAGGAEVCLGVGVSSGGRGEGTGLRRSPRSWPRPVRASRCRPDFAPSIRGVWEPVAPLGQMRFGQRDGRCGTGLAEELGVCRRLGDLGCAPQLRLGSAARRAPETPALRSHAGAQINGRADGSAAPH